MQPIQSMEVLRQNWKSTKEHEGFDKYPGLYAFLLYSQADTSFLRFIRSINNWNAIHRMSTDNCLIFVFEEPIPPDVTQEVKEKILDRNEKYWTYLLGYSADSRFYQLHPFDNENIYKIAKDFGIPFNKLPCFVFFKDIEEKDVYWKSITEFFDDDPDEKTDNMWLQAIQEIFWEVPDSYDAENKEELFNKLKSEFRKSKLKKTISSILKSTYKLVKDIIITIK